LARNSMRIEILDLAKTDLLEGFHFYEDREKGLGDYFLTNVISDIERLKISGGIHRQSHRGFYRALSKRFPVAIYYTVGDDAVWIRSIVDCRRRPSWIRAHLKKA
jgi:hypothetical protein